MKIYLAGTMDNSRDKVAPWRSRVMAAFGRDLKHPLEWLCPEQAGCDHHGWNGGQVVEGDLQMIREADLVLAFLSRPVLYATLAEVGYAVGIGKPVWIMETSFIVNRDEDEARQTGHTCACMRDHSIYWFLHEMVRQSEGRVFDDWNVVLQEIQDARMNDRVPSAIPGVKDSRW